MRISNFLLWQISYAEIVILQKNWPDFRKDDLTAAVAEYQRRHRRFGALPGES
jgi:undecaprenyl diphosphate synthase